MDKLLDRAAVADILDITTETLDKMCKAGNFARSITIGKRQRWRAKELREWLDQKFNEEDRS